MLLRTEIDTADQKALIIAHGNTPFTELLKEKLKEKNVVVTVRKEMNSNYKTYSYIIFINYSLVVPSEFKDCLDIKIIYILFGQKDKVDMLTSYVYDHKLNNIKIVRLDSKVEFFKKDIDTIFWFTSSQTSESYLHIYHDIKIKEKNKSKYKEKIPLRTKIKNPKNLFTIVCCFFLISQIIFIPLLAASTYFNYKASNNAYSQKPHGYYQKAGKITLEFAKTLYIFAKPSFHFLSIALPVEDLFQINESTTNILISANNINNQADVFMNGFSISNKTDKETSEMADALLVIKEELITLSANVDILKEKLPAFTADLKKNKKELEKISNALHLLIEFTPHFDNILAKNKEKKYLMLFANNMELRPGGGFIGSFAILKMKNYSISDLKFYDVYDADGQLKEHIDPPKPISKFLNQTHWFLRDSAFTGDFVQNLKEAEMLLQKEMDEKNFDGSILITTSGVQNLLKSVKSLYVPDYKETINSENFYIKAQLYAEDNYFQGSKQKKGFLSSVASQMLFGMHDISLPIVFSEIERSLDQKHIVLFFKDTKLQNLIETNYWSGRTLKPTCSVADALHCIPDYLFPLDANLGVNKANFYIQKQIKLEINIDDDGNIKNTYTSIYSNNSFEKVFPGGIYKNYLQLMMPPNSIVESVKLDGVDIQDYDEENFQYKTVGFLMQVNPQQSKTVQITYKLPTTIISGSGIYQLILQKQIGMRNMDLQLKISIPKNITIVRHNLSSLADDSEIIYNTSISSDKIFVLEFNKK